MDSKNYEIKLADFEGPFDLLLFFIERDELNIHNIPISKITDDFLAYVKHMQSFNMELASEFIFVASTLMRIKAKMLLPKVEEDIEEDDVDLKEDLVQKLILYKQFKSICEDLRQLEDRRSRQYWRGNTANDLKRLRNESVQQLEDDLSSFDLYKLMLMYEGLMRNYNLRPKESKHTVVKHPYSIDQQKKAIQDLLTINQSLDFSKLAENSENKVQFVFNFIAVLEMLQQQIIDIQVGLGFNDFQIKQKPPIASSKN
ncbi:MAG: segregation and condensation protein A [Sphingobacterium sp.]